MEKYVDKVFDEIFNSEIDKDSIVEMFSEKFENLAKEMPMSNRWRSACRIVAKKVVRDSFEEKVSWRVTKNCQIDWSANI